MLGVLATDTMLLIIVAVHCQKDGGRREVVLGLPDAFEIIIANGILAREPALKLLTEISVCRRNHDFCPRVFLGLLFYCSI